MQIHGSHEAIVIDGIDEFFAGLLRRVPTESNVTDDDPAADRIYALPFSEEADEDACEEWRELVHPELKQLFQDAMLTVRSDLQKMFTAGPLADGNYRLSIARGNFDAWLSALNQARLALAERNQLGEADLEGQGPKTLANDRDVAVFEVQFLGFIQEFLIRAINADE